jgi:hypothetical protein
VKILYVGAIVYVCGIAVSSGITLSTIVAWAYGQRHMRQRAGVPECEMEQRKEPKTTEEVVPPPDNTGAAGKFSDHQEDTWGQKRRWFLWGMFTFGWISAAGSWMIWTGFANLAQDV